MLPAPNVEHCFGWRTIIWLDEYESPVVIFGARSSPAVAEYCFQRTAEEFAPSEKGALNAVKKDIYVGVVFTGAVSVEDTTHLVARVPEVLDKGGFKLGRWSTNSEVVWQSLSPELRSEELVNIDIKEHTERALVVFWSPTTETLVGSWGGQLLYVPWQQLAMSLPFVQRSKMSQQLNAQYSPLWWLCTIHWDFSLAG